MRIFPLSGGEMPVPATIHVTTTAFAYSKTGFPLGTSGLSNCIGLVLHDPAGKQGCLGHLTPDQSTDRSIISRYFKHCIGLMGLTPEQCQQVQIVVMGGGSRVAPFVQAFTEALQENSLLLANCFDARYSLRGPLQAPYIGQQVQEVPGGAVQGVYSPRDEAIWISGNPLDILPYVHAEAKKTKTETSFNNIVQADYVHGAVLGT